MMNKKNMIKLVVVVAIAVGVYMLLNKKKSTNGGSSDKFTVYGTDWCGYTTKQRKHLDNKYGANSHTYVNCDKEKCPGVDGFPVTITNSGKKISGFNDSL